MAGANLTPFSGGHTNFSAATCRAAGEMCLFCELDHTDPNIAGAVAIVNLSLNDGLSVDKIAQIVAKDYKENWAEHVTLLHPVTHQPVSAPAWPQSSIQRHILVSGQFPAAASGTIATICKDVVYRLGTKLFTDEGEIDTENAKQFKLFTELYLKLQ